MIMSLKSYAHAPWQLKGALVKAQTSTASLGKHDPHVVCMCVCVYVCIYVCVSLIRTCTLLPLPHALTERRAESQGADGQTQGMHAIYNYERATRYAR